MILSKGGIPLLIGALAFLTIYFFFIGVIYYFRQRAKKRKLVGRMREGDEELEKEDSPSEGAGMFKKPILSFLGSVGRRTFSAQTEDYSQMRIKFLRAGLRRTNVSAVFYGAKSFLAILLPVSFFLLRISVFRLLNPTMTLAGCLLLAFIGFYLPDIWLRIKTARRRERIAKGIPDALDLLVVCVEAGMGLNAAINRVGEEIKFTHREVSDEFKLLNLELRTGKARDDALRNLANRIDLEDVNSLVTLLIQTDKFGTSVAQALRVYSDAFRTKRYQRAEEQAAKLPVKLLFPLILFIFPSLFVAIFGPAAIRLYQVILQP